MNDKRILYLFTRTPLHVGAGSSVGAIDQPIIRERHTGFPVIPGSSIKGVLRDHFRDLASEVVNELFGRGDEAEKFTAGRISFGEARLLLFPVRSAKGAFALATSPLALQRFARDSGHKIAIPAGIDDMSCWAGSKVVIDQKAVVLEEYRFKQVNPFPTEWEKVLTGILDDSVLAGAAGRFVLLSDGDLSHFAQNACEIHQHVRIDDETGRADEGGLFNAEAVPSETLFYSQLTVLRGSSNNPVFESLSGEQLLQFGGNGTTGLGFCTLKLGK